jgi:hypothetical protein
MNFEINKDGDSLTVETHEDQVHLHLEGDAVDTDGFTHSCVTGMWLTCDEAAQLRDSLTVALFVIERKASR